MSSPSLSLILSNHVLNSFSASDWNSLIFAINSVQALKSSLSQLSSVLSKLLYLSLNWLSYCANKPSVLLTQLSYTPAISVRYFSILCLYALNSSSTAALQVLKKSVNCFVSTLASISSTVPVTIPQTALLNRWSVMFCVCILVTPLPTYISASASSHISVVRVTAVAVGFADGVPFSTAIYISLCGKSQRTTTLSTLLSAPSAVSSVTLSVAGFLKAQPFIKAQPAFTLISMPL